MLDDLLTEHRLYKRLGKEKNLRYKNYKSLFDGLNINEQAKKITEATLGGVVYGSNKFHSRTAKLIARPTRLVTHEGGGE